MDAKKNSEQLDGKKSRLKININDDDYNTNDFLFCWDRFDGRPNRIVMRGTYSSQLFNVVISKYILEKNVLSDVIPDENTPIINDKVLAKIDDECYLSYIVGDRDSDASFIDSVTFYYKNGFDGIDAIMSDLEECTLDYTEETPSRLNSITISETGLEIEPIQHKEAEADIDHYYTADTFKQLGKVVKKIKKSETGLAILHGERGTGKTSAINYLASKLDRIVIFIPNNMIEHTINNPVFRNFIRKYERPVLVLDDCEMLFNEFFAKSNMFSNNLLQMVDGLLADQTNVCIVAIFNLEREDEIDHSMLECNNLIGVVEFGRLSEKESNELAKLIESGKKYKHDTRLVDIVKKRDFKGEIEMGF